MTIRMQNLNQHLIMTMSKELKDITKDMNKYINKCGGHKLLREAQDNTNIWINEVTQTNSVEKNTKENPN